MTDEEILEKYIEGRKINGEWEFEPTKEGALKAMDEYAKQEAIEFKKWYDQSEWSGFMKSNSDERKTLSEIYSIYLSSKPK